MKREGTFDVVQQLKSKNGMVTDENLHDSKQGNGLILQCQDSYDSQMGMKPLFDHKASYLNDEWQQQDSKMEDRALGDISSNVINVQ